MVSQLSRRSFLKQSSVAFAGLGALWLAACVPPTPGAPASDASAQSGAGAAPAPEASAPVLALLRAGDGEEDFFNRAIDMFEAQHPETKIGRIFVPGGQEYITKLDLMIAAGDPPAIYAPFSDRGYRYYASKGLSQELDDFVARDNLDLSDFHPDGMKGCRWQGKLMALPLDLWPHLIFYNKTLFREAGIPDLPTDWNDASWTVDKYLEIAKQLTKKEGDQVVQYGSDVYFNYWASGWTFGGDFLPASTYEIGVVDEFAGDTDPRVAASVQWSADLMLKDQVAPTPAQAQQVQAGAPVLFMSGKIAMGISNIGRLSRYAGIDAFEWGTAAAPNPPNGEKRHLHVWIDFWSMIKGVKNLEGSWQFLKFMVSPEVQKIYPIEYGPQSSLLSLAPDWLAIQKQKLPNLSDAELAVMTEAPKQEQIDPENWTVNFSVINSQALQPALDLVWLGEKDAATAIAEAAPKIRKLIDETKNV
ncbi:MAG: sugar ABC transporter substrate-binding protein [Chloroflexi bacterium]|nr:sugar ABC transporter substrate-binding protein [Chloroflexota bacterium]